MDMKLSEMSLKLNLLNKITMKLFPAEVYTNRRNQLRAKIKEGIAIIIGNVNVPYNYPANIYRFRQDSTFLYFFGLQHPGYVGVIDFDEGKDYIFANDIDIEDIIWTGNLPSIAEESSKVGIRQTLKKDKLPELIKEAVIKNRKIHILPPYRAEIKLYIAELMNISVNQIFHFVSNDLLNAVIDLRIKKEDTEITHLDSIMSIGYQMHVSAMKLAKEGIYEREIAGYMEGLALSQGGFISFPVILSKHGEILHNESHDNLLKNGDLLLVDAGYESEMGYATDNTRTFAVGGKFTDKQKEIYNIVLKANEEVTRNAKPGITYLDMHILAAKNIVSGLKDLGLMKGDIEEAVAAGAHALFFPHGLGHAMGLDVHDMENLGEDKVGYTPDMNRSSQFGTAYLRFARKLEYRHVITNEPGIYFIPALIDMWKKESKFSNFIDYDQVAKYRDFGGIRIEDDILITTDGCRLLGDKRIPAKPDEMAMYIGIGL